MMFFNKSNGLCESVFTGSKIVLYDVRRNLGVNFSRHILAETAKMQRINSPSFFNLMPSILAS